MNARHAISPLLAGGVCRYRCWGSVRVGVSVYSSDRMLRKPLLSFFANALITYCDCTPTVSALLCTLSLPLSLSRFNLAIANEYRLEEVAREYDCFGVTGTRASRPTAGGVGNFKFGYFRHPKRMYLLYRVRRSISALFNGSSRSN